MEIKRKKNYSCFTKAFFLFEEQLEGCSHSGFLFPSPHSIFGFQSGHRVLGQRSH